MREKKSQFTSFIEDKKLLPLIEKKTFPSHFPP